MPLENPNFLDDLNDQNPGTLDQKSEGDDHIRGVKKALKATFPGMAGRAWRKRNVSSSGSVTRTDNMTLLNCAAGLELVPEAASSLGNGFMFMARAPSTGSFTINPGQNINGQESYTVPPDHTALVFSDGSEFFLMLVYNNPPAAVQVFPSGTRMVFQQTTSPTGWTKVVSASHNNAGLRFTTGTVGTGGADDFTTVFGTGKSTAGHAITVTQMAPHTHSVPSGGARTSAIDYQTNGPDFGAAQTTGSTGGGATHSHVLNNMNLKYVDCIVGSKD